MTTAELAIDAITEVIADQLNGFLHDWNATAQGDITGRYVQLGKKENPDNEDRSLFLDVMDEKDDKTDLTRYCWNYWNASRNQWHVSDLGPNASFNDIVDFLVRNLESE